MKGLIQLKILRIRINIERFKVFICKRMKPSSKIRNRLLTSISINMMWITNKSYELNVFSLEELKRIHGVN